MLGAATARILLIRGFGLIVGREQPRSGESRRRRIMDQEGGMRFASPALRRLSLPVRGLKLYDDSLHSTCPTGFI